MISDFIALTNLESSVYRSKFVCELPDIDNEDDVMIECGHVSIDEDESEVCHVTIHLHDNFQSLCVGDTYQQKHFAQTILDVLSMQTDYDFSDAKITVRDFLGERTVAIEQLDETFY